MKNFVRRSISFLNMSNDIQDHYQVLEDEHRAQLNALPAFPAPVSARPPMNIIADQIIQSGNDDYMKLLSNFTTGQFQYIYSVLEPVLSARRHRDAIASPKTMLLITLCHLKHNEAWRKIAVFYGISPAYCYQIALHIIATCHQLLKDHFIKWTVVIDINYRSNHQLQLKI